MLRALVIYPPKKQDSDVGDLLKIARAQAQKRERTHQNVKVLSLVYDPITQVHVALYNVPE